MKVVVSRELGVFVRPLVYWYNFDFEMVSFRYGASDDNAVAFREIDLLSDMYSWLEGRGPGLWTYKEVVSPFVGDHKVGIREYRITVFDRLLAVRFALEFL